MSSSRAITAKKVYRSLCLIILFAPVIERNDIKLRVHGYCSRAGDALLTATLNDVKEYRKTM